MPKDKAPDRKGRPQNSVNYVSEEQAGVKPAPEAIGLALKILRQTKVLSQVEVAKTAEISQSTLSEMEGGKAVTVTSIERVALAMGYSLWQVMRFAEHLSEHAPGAEAFGVLLEDARSSLVELGQETSRRRKKRG